ncbi:hypothetical protein EDD85DRAFT_955100 [Armillaria nabsnona]|nr:hypothetical protein EDD85DRAFT_955100 [Armillaria nabsnona]
MQSITAPVIDLETNTIASWPIVSCFRVCGMDSLEEEDIFTVKVHSCELQTQWEWFPHHTVCSTIPDLNVEHRFNPACDGADVCEYFGWPLLELLDPSTGEWILNGQILSQEHDSVPHGMDMVAGSIIEEVQAGEASVKMENVSIVGYDISTSLIIIFIAKYQCSDYSSVIL